MISLAKFLPRGLAGVPAWERDVRALMARATAAPTVELGLMHLDRAWASLAHAQLSAHFAGAPIPVAALDALAEEVGRVESRLTPGPATPLRKK